MLLLGPAVRGSFIALHLSRVASPLLALNPLLFFFFLLPQSVSLDRLVVARKKALKGSFQVSKNTGKDREPPTVVYLETQRVL